MQGSSPAHGAALPTPLQLPRPRPHPSCPGFSHLGLARLTEAKHALKQALFDTCMRMHTLAASPTQHSRSMLLTVPRRACWATVLPASSARSQSATPAARPAGSRAGSGHAPEEARAGGWMVASRVRHATRALGPLTVSLTWATRGRWLVLWQGAGTAGTGMPSTVPAVWVESKALLLASARTRTLVEDFGGQHGAFHARVPAFWLLSRAGLVSGKTDSNCSPFLTRCMHGWSCVPAMTRNRPLHRPLLRVVSFPGGHERAHAACAGEPGGQVQRKGALSQLRRVLPRLALARPPWMHIPELVQAAG